MGQSITVPLGQLKADPEPSGPITVPLETLGAPTFRSENEKTAGGDAVVRDANTVGTMLRHFWQNFNPAQIGQMLPFPKAAGGSGTDHPLALDPSNQYAPNLAVQMQAVKKEADRLWEQGDRVGATAKYVESAIPLFGPMLSNWGDEAQQGKIAALIGDALGFAGALKTPQVASAAVRGAKTATINVADRARTAAADVLHGKLNPAEVASNEFAAANNIPLDAATATGSRFLRGVQKPVGESLLGQAPAVRTRTAQTEGLARVGDELATKANDGGAAVTAEGAGEGVRGSIHQLITNLKDRANKFYGELRDYESRHVDTVPKVEDPSIVKGRQAREEASIGYSPSEAVRQHLRVIKQELDEVQYHDGKLVQDRGLDDSSTEYLPRQANAAVYHEITEAAPGISDFTGADMRRAIESALETGHYTNAAKGALAVAEGRLRGRGKSSQMFDANDPYFSKGTEQMGLAVDITPARPVLKPILDRLQKKKDLTGQLMGGEAQAVVALDSIVNGPTHVPLSVLDAALGDLKAMARGGRGGPSIPELRTGGQGTAAFAVKELEKLIQERARAAGPEVLRALQEGRSAAKAKFEVGELFEGLADEPVRVFDKLTAPKDANIQMLRKVQEAAPEAMADVARAWLERQMSLATQEGGFGHADRLWSDWNKLGTETKRVLFPKEGQTAALDQFFLLAKRIAENPNPSGTAATGIKAGEVIGLVTAPSVSLPATLTMGAVSKLLYSKGGVEALTRWLRVNAPTRVVGRTAAAASPVAKAAAWSAVRLAGQRAGVEIPALAADSDETR